MNVKITKYILWITITFMLISCNWLKTDVEIKKQTYFLEFIDSAQTKQSKKVIDEASSQLQNEQFILSLEDNDWQGVISYTDEVDLSDLSKYYPEIHEFKALEKNSDVQDYKVKIELVYNKQTPDSVPNFNVKMYVRSADNNMWKNFANPGNFRFNTDYYGKDEQTAWIKRTIVGLTFK